MLSRAKDKRDQHFLTFLTQSSSVHISTSSCLFSSDHCLFLAEHCVKVCTLFVSFHSDLLGAHTEWFLYWLLSAVCYLLRDDTDKTIQCGVVWFNTRLTTFLSKRLDFHYQLSRLLQRTIFHF